MSNPELIEAIRTFDPTGMIWLIKEHKKSCISYAKKSLTRLRGVEAADDAEGLFNHALIALTSNIRSGSLTEFKGNVRNYLITVMKNKRIREWELAKRKPLVLDYEVEEIDEELEALRNGVRRYIRELGDKCKEILTMFYYDDFSYDDIIGHSRFEYTTAEGARMVKKRCMDKLRRSLGVTNLPKNR